MLLKCELMLLKCQIHTNTTKNGSLLSTKCLEGVLKYSCILIALVFSIALRRCADCSKIVRLCVEPSYKGTICITLDEEVGASGVIHGAEL